MFKGLQLVLAAIIVLGLYHMGYAQFSGGGGGGVTSVNGQSGAVTIVPGSFVGQFTLATLPACDNVVTKYGSYAYATDLGGGANIIKCVAGSWQHTAQGIPQDNAANSGTIVLQALVTAPIINMTGNPLTTMNLQLQPTGLYPGYCVNVVKTGLITGVLGIQVLGVGSQIPILGNSKNQFCWNGTSLLQTQ